MIVGVRTNHWIARVGVWVDVYLGTFKGGSESPQPALGYLRFFDTDSQPFIQSAAESIPKVDALNKTDGI